MPFFKVVMGLQQMSYQLDIITLLVSLLSLDHQNHCIKKHLIFSYVQQVCAKYTCIAQLSLTI